MNDLFSEAKNISNIALTYETGEVARAKKELKRAENDLERRQQSVRDIENGLAATALSYVATDSNSTAPAWEYIGDTCTYKESTWEVIMSRLPKLLALKEAGKTDELYLRLAKPYGDYSGQEATSAMDTQVAVRSDTLQVGSFDFYSQPRKDESIKNRLQYPTKQVDGSSEYFVGALIGNDEIAEFIRENAADIDPRLLTGICLELAQHSAGIDIYKAIPDKIREAVVSETFDYLCWYPNSRGDKLSSEVKEYPKVVQLLLAEAGIDKKFAVSDEEDCISYISYRDEEYTVLNALYDSYKRKAGNQTPKDPSYDTSFIGIYHGALSHWYQMRDLDWSSVDF